jgi:hypothetical protein
LKTSCGRNFFQARRPALIGAWGFALLACQGVASAETYALRSGKPDGVPIQVTARLEVGGNLEMATDQQSASDKSTAASDKDSQTVPMSVVGQFSYDEQRVDDGSTPAHRMSVRSYDDAQAVIKIGSKVTKPQLRDDRKLITAVAGKESAYLSSTSGPLTRDELELIDIPASTLVLDQLLPQADIEIGHKWKPSTDTLARFLCLDAVGHSEVEATLADVKNNIAEITLDGTLGGAIDGVATDIQLKAKMLFDLELNQPKTLLLAIKEVRGIGHVSPGLDVVAKLSVRITPQPSSKLLTDDIVKSAKLPDSDVPPPLEYVATDKSFRFAYDRRWHLTRDDSDLLVMRLIDRGDLVAQCNVSPSKLPLPSGEGAGEGAGVKLITLAEFQNDVQQALGKLFGKFNRATESTTSSGNRVLLSIAEGAAAELPIQWRYYFIHDKSGHALTCIFTMETPLVEQFRDQDQPIISSVEFSDSKLARRP